MLREIKSEYIHYFMDEFGRIQGEFKSWHYNGAFMYYHQQCVDAKLHGECKEWYDNGVLKEHGYWVDDELVHDFIASPLTDIEKMLLVLKYGAPMLPRGGIC